MKLNRHEVMSLVVPAGVLGLAWLVSAFFMLIPRDKLALTIFVSEGYGAMQTDTIETVWNSTAGLMGASIIATFVVGVYLGSHMRTYLGSGTTRRETILRLAVIGGLITAFLTAMAGLLWGISALTMMPEIRGVSPLALLSIPLGQIVGYSVGVFAASTFVRFVWWKVLIALVALRLIISGGMIFVNRYAQPFVIDLNLAQTMGILALSAIAAWGIAWLFVRELPMRRS